MAKADNHLNNIISEIPSFVNKEVAKQAERQQEADTYLENEIGIPKELYGNLLDNYFSQYDLDSVKVVYETMVEYLDKGEDYKRQGINTLTREFSALFRDNGLEPAANMLLKDDYFDRIREFVDDPNDYQFDFWFKKSNKDLNSFAKQYTDNLLNKLADQMTDAVAGAYVLDAITQCNGLKGIVRFANEDSCEDWVNQRHDILYGASSGNPDYFAYKGKTMTPKDTATLVNQLNAIDIDSL